jgi:hypothetical protein
MDRAGAGKLNGPKSQLAGSSDALAEVRNREVANLALEVVRRHSGRLSFRRDTPK